MTHRKISTAFVLSLLSASISLGALGAANSALACDGESCKHDKAEKCEHCDCKEGKGKCKHKNKKDKKAKETTDSAEKAE